MRTRPAWCNIILARRPVSAREPEAARTRWCTRQKHLFEVGLQLLEVHTRLQRFQRISRPRVRFRWRHTLVSNVLIRTLTASMLRARWGGAGAETSAMDSRASAGKGKKGALSNGQPCRSFACA